MKKAIKISAKVLKVIGLLLLLKILVLAIAIPYGRSSEKDMPELGISYGKVIIKGVNILPMDIDTILYNKNIYLEANKIIAITPDSILNSGFEIINAQGKFIMPGLIDMHAHIFDRTDLPQYLSYGVTTVRNMMGFPMHLRWKQQLSENKLLGSQLITGSPTINSGDNAGPFHKIVDNASEAHEAVEEYLNEGYDFIKVYDDVDSLQMDAIQKAAIDKNAQITGHPPKMSLDGLLSSSMVSIEHTEELLKFLDKERSEESIRELAKQIKVSNKAVTLNLVAFNRINRISQEGSSYYESLQNDRLNPVTKFIGTKQLEIYTQAGTKYKQYAQDKYRAMENLCRILNEERVNILFGTDSGPNFIVAGASIIEEMELLREAGLTGYDVLRSATFNAAKTLNKPNLGKVQVGSTANLIVFNENPIENFNVFSSPNMLFTRSKYYSNNDLTEIRSIGENKQNTYATIGLFLEHLINK